VSEWEEVAKTMGMSTATDGPGSRSASWFIEKVTTEAASANDPLTPEQVEFLGKHLMSMDADPSALVVLQSKVVRHARNALRKDLKAGGQTVKVGVFAKWPKQWLDHYQRLIESNNMMAISGVLQNAFAPNGKLWKP
jgi:hypothetical protein